MKNKDILLLNQALPQLSPPEMDRWFNYAVQETIQRASAKAISIREVIAPKDGMKEYQKALKELQEEHAKKDEYNQPIREIKPIGNGKQMERYEIPELNNPNGKFNLAAKELDLKYDKAINEYNECLKFLDEENTDFEPYWVKVDQIPNGLTRNEMAAVFLMINKEDAE